MGLESRGDPASRGAQEPFRFSPHGAQVWTLKRLQRFNILVCHRGWGKTTLAVHYLTEQACNTPGGRFAYLSPLYRQAKQSAWDGLKQASAAPGVVPWVSELRVDFPNDARIQLFGGENYQALRGMHLDGIVLDEYADMSPNIWTEVIRPTLAAKQGFAIFIGTPRGRNDFYRLYVQAPHEGWFRALYRFQDSGVIGPLRGDEAHAEVDAARRAMTPEHFQQEYECSFEAAIVGAYYGPQMSQLRAEGRIRLVPHVPSAKVETFWDLGKRDATAIIFVQRAGREIHVIDYLTATGQELAYYAHALSRKPYLYARHTVPHDADAERLEGPKIARQLRELVAPVPVTVLPQAEIQPGIEAARRLLARCWFDDDKTRELVEALSAYRPEWDEDKRVFRDKPRHDWASHGADAFRYLAVAWKDETVYAPRKPLVYGRVLGALR